MKVDSIFVSKLIVCSCTVNVALEIGRWTPGVLLLQVRNSWYSWSWQVPIC